MLLGGGASQGSQTQLVALWDLLDVQGQWFWGKTNQELVGGWTNPGWKNMTVKLGSSSPSSKGEHKKNIRNHHLEDFGGSFNVDCSFTPGDVLIHFDILRSPNLQKNLWNYRPRYAKAAPLW